ncbi:YcgN family cysteine cluster protein [Shewanella sp. 202IG2-18]|uniref:YcgN family cysteine cluster protein n=1 Tax=Parashewanella hymeniacidonis TaxID=2807618 RepID=UPI00195F787F|nr:YcgN family cysteine cluster protein [Parashewanella hymeniacidonis]MBM7073839.1 YcgN family cysteine cluster protein [Parashewanella hymeniacidonis]
MAFWEEKSLSEMTSLEWESLCDGCGKCCLNKIIDDETNELFYTDAACKLLDHKMASCKDYSNRTKLVPECTVITIENLSELDWLPESCAYRRLYLGKTLPKWHPFITGNKKKMHKLDMSIKDKVIDERSVKYLEDHIVMWPLYDID